MYSKSFVSDSTKTVYSVDMIRLNFDMGKTAQSWCDYLSNLAEYSSDYDIQYFPSYKQYHYRHMWQITCVDDGKESCSFAIGMHLGKSAEDVSKGFIEFNPNKCMGSKSFDAIWTAFRLHTVTRDLVRYDLAIDIPLERSQCRLVREGRKFYQLVSKDDGLTEYLGKRSSNGFVKLYDKTAESKLDTALTRLEITLDAGVSLESVWPKVLLFENQMSLISDELNSTYRVMVLLLRQVEDLQYYLGQLSWHLRKKIEPYLADKTLSMDHTAFINAKAYAYSFETNYIGMQ